MKKYLLLIGLFLTSTLFAQTPIQVEARIDSHIVQNNQKKIRGDSLHDILEAILYANNAPSLMQDGFVVTPTVTWITGYTYQVSPAVYVIGGVLYTTLSTSITLDAADATNDRIDLFVLTTSSTAIDVTGTPAATPVEPDIDAQTQLRVSFALVQASTTQPTIANLWIYQENAGTPTEWAYSDNTANLNPASTNNPYDGTVDIEGTTVANTNRFIMTPATFPSLVNYNAVVFKIRSKAAWGTRRILIQFMNGASPIGTAASFGNNAYGFNSLVTGSYQNIAIPLIDFGNISGATALRFQASMTSGTIGFYIDDIQLTGISTTTPITGGAHQVLYFNAAGNITSDATFFRQPNVETYMETAIANNVSFIDITSNGPSAAASAASGSTCFDVSGQFSLSTDSANKSIQIQAIGSRNDSAFQVSSELLLVPNATTASMLMSDPFLNFTSYISTGADHTNNTSRVDIKAANNASDTLTQLFLYKDTIVMFFKKSTGTQDTLRFYTDGDTIHIAGDEPIKIGNGSLTVLPDGSVIMSESVSIGYQYATPATTDTVVSNGKSSLVIDPAGALLALSVSFPDNPKPGQIFEMIFTQAVTTATLLNGTILGAITAAVANTTYSYKFVTEISKWVKAQ